MSREDVLLLDEIRRLREARLLKRPMNPIRISRRLRSVRLRRRPQNKSRTAA
jgi:hypothetical protein